MMEANVTPSSSIELMSGHRERLESAGVGEDRAIPAHEPMTSASPGHQIIARPQHEVIGVIQDDLTAGLPNVVGRQPLDRRFGAHGHEGGRVERAVRSCDAANACGSMAALMQNGKRQRRRHDRSRASPVGRLLKHPFFRSGEALKAFLMDLVKDAIDL